MLFHDGDHVLAGLGGDRPDDVPAPGLLDEAAGLADVALARARRVAEDRLDGEGPARFAPDILDGQRRPVATVAAEGRVVAGGGEQDAEA